MLDSFTLETDSGELVQLRKRKASQDSRIERQIITGMVISDRFIKEIQPLLNNANFQADYAGKVAYWCQEYFQEYSKAPNKQIEDIFLSHQDDIPEDQSRLIETFLSGLSEEYERDDACFNVDYILDKAEQHFRLCSLKALQDDLNKCIRGNRLEDGESLVKEYQRPERLKRKGIDPIRDTEFIIRSLKPDEDNPNIVLRLPGALGRAMGPLERGDLYAILAESGKGKTWWMQFMSRVAVMDGFNVAWFSLEMSEEKMGARIWQDLTGNPTEGDGKISIPVFDCKLNQSGDCRKPERMGKGFIRDDKPSPEYKPCDACRGYWDTNQMTTFWKKEDRTMLDAASAIHKRDVMLRTGFLKRAGRFHLVEFPEGEFSVDDWKAYMNNLEYYDNFIADLIVTDYADKFRLDNSKDFRNSIGRIWSVHKGMAQKRHCAVLTGSQSNTERSGKRVSKAAWAENIEKQRGISGGIAFNQSDEDDEMGIMWATVIKKRHRKKMAMVDVAILQQLEIGRPYIDSCFVRRVKKN